ESVDYVTSQQFDSRDHVAQTTSARGTSTRYTYDDGTDQLRDATVLDESNNERERRHLTLDTAGKKIREEDQTCASPAAICTTWLTKRDETYAYDSLERLADVHNDGFVIRYTYDSDGNLRTVQDENHASAN